MNDMETSYNPELFERSFHLDRKSYTTEELERTLFLAKEYTRYAVRTNIMHPSKRHKGAIDLMMTSQSDPIPYESMNGNALEPFKEESVYSMPRCRRNKLFKIRTRSKENHDGAVIYDKEGYIMPDKDGKYDPHWVDMDLEDGVPKIKGGAKTRLAVWASHYGYLLVKLSEGAWASEMFINGQHAPREEVEKYVAYLKAREREKATHMSVSTQSAYQLAA